MDLTEYETEEEERQRLWSAGRRTRRLVTVGVAVVVVSSTIQVLLLLPSLRPGGSVIVPGAITDSVAGPKSSPAPGPGAAASAPVPPRPVLSPPAPLPHASPLAPLVAGQPVPVDSLQLFGQSGWGTATGCRLVCTSDGGQTWAPVSSDLPPSVASCTPFFLDPEHAWVVASNANGTGVTLERTADGGATWVPATLPGGPADDVSLSFVNPADGFYAEVGEPTQEYQQQSIAVWVTSDSGAHWHQVNASPPLLAQSTSPVTAGQLPGTCGKQTGISFLSAQTGWVTGGCLGAGTSGITFAVTHDGGTSWFPQQLPSPSGGLDCQAGPCEVSSPVFTSIADGSLLIGDYGSNLAERFTLCLTTDGGASWTAEAMPGTTSGVQFLNAQIGWATGGTSLYATSDGGASWHQLPDLPLAGGVVRFTDSLDGFLIPGPNGAGSAQPYLTADGGQTWAAFTPHLVG